MLHLGFFKNKFDNGNLIIHFLSIIISIPPVSGPLKRVKKLYLEEPSVPVPRRTLSRWKKKNSGAGGDEVAIDNDCSASSQDYMETQDTLTEVAACLSSQKCSSGEDDNVKEEYPSIEFAAGTDPSSTVLADPDDESSFDSADSVSSAEDSTSSSGCEEADTSDSEAASTDEDEQMTDYDGEGGVLSEKEKQGLQILSCFLKHHLSASACKDILSLMKTLFRESETAKNLTFDDLWKLCGPSKLKEIHYCEECESIFPDDPAQYACQTDNCSGLRYEGGLSDQIRSGCKPRKSFVLSDIKKQLSTLLEAPGKFLC